MVEGLPGHAAEEGFPLRLQLALREAGCRFEAEGGVTRIHLGGSVVEVRAEGAGAFIQVNIPLPGRGGEDPEYFMGALREGLGLVLSLRGALEYEVDPSIPGYPMLRVKCSYERGEELLEDLARYLKSLGGRGAEG